MATYSTACECRQVSKRYGGHRGVSALDGLELTIRPGECFGLLGPNAAGKTTALDIIAGLTKPTSGDVTVLGMRWATHARILRRRVAIALQQTQLPGRLTVYELLRLFRSFYPTGPAVGELIERLGLSAKRDTWYARLSGGQQRRVALGCSLVGDPELLLLDEPTTGLDPHARRRFWELTGELREERRTVVLCTHHIEEAERLCDRVAVLDHGRVIACGSPRRLVAEWGGPGTVSFVPSAPIEHAVLAGLPGVCRVDRSAQRYELTVVDAHDCVAAMFRHAAGSGIRIQQLTTRQPSLEDVFVSLTGRPLRA